MAEFAFNELSAESQERALEECRRIFDLGSIVQSSQDLIKEFLTEQLKKRSLPTDQVRFRVEYESVTRIKFYGKVNAPKIAQKVLSKREYRLLRSISQFLQLEVDINDGGYGGIDVRVRFRGDGSNLDHHRDMQDVLRKFASEVKTYVQATARELAVESTNHVWSGSTIRDKLLSLVRGSALVFDEQGRLSWNWV